MINKLCIESNHKYNSAENIIEKCTNLKKIKKLDSGSYGNVYLAKNKNKDKYVIKEIIINKDNKETYDDIQIEIEYSKKMDKLNIGPKIYDVFYCIFKDKIIQYIIMDAGNGDVSSLISSYISVDIEKMSIKYMIKLIKKQIDNGIYCLDIKPSNFIYYFKNGRFNVKMIDFGLGPLSNKIKWCGEKLGDIFNNKEEFYVYILIQLFYMSVINEDYDCEIYEPFFEDNIFMKYVKDINIIKNLLMNIMTNDKQNITKQFRHYLGIKDKFFKSSNIENKIDNLLNNIMSIYNCIYF